MLVRSRLTMSNSHPVDVGVSIIILITPFLLRRFALGLFINVVIVSPRHLIKRFIAFDKFIIRSLV